MLQENNMYDVVALGELLVDLTPSDEVSSKVLFEMNPGGAPANVLAGLTKLGLKTAFIGKVGNDQFGRDLAQTLINTGIDVSGLKYSNQAPTTLAIVQLTEAGERSFSFYRNPGADQLLSAKEILYEQIENACIFHFGSISMTKDPSKTATLKAVQFAQEKGVIVSYDPNLRLSLWDSPEQAKKQILEGFQYTDILKLSEEELFFLTGINDLHKGATELLKNYPIKLIFITLGEKGSFVQWNDTVCTKPSVSVEVIDTTGAGDAFFAGVLYQVVKNKINLSQLSVEQLEKMLSFANAMGAFVTTKKGAIPAMPSFEEVSSIANR